MNFFEWSSEFREYMVSKYKEYHWWESTDAKELARYQLYEPRLAIPFGQFHEGIEQLLGRGVWTHEFGDSECLQRELEAKG